MTPIFKGIRKKHIKVMRQIPHRRKMKKKFNKTNNVRKN